MMTIIMNVDDHDDGVAYVVVDESDDVDEYGDEYDDDQ